MKKKGKIRRFFLWLTLLVMICTVPLASLAASVRITLQPEDATVPEGGTAVFRAAAKNDTGITWRMQSPDGQSVFLVKEIGQYFPGASAEGRNSDTLTIRRVTKEMHNWQVFCTYGGQNRVETNRAAIKIQGMDEISNLPEENNDPAFTYTGSDALAIHCIGASLEVNGSVVSQPFDFSAVGKINCRIKAFDPVDYWVINGAKYEFDIVPMNITVRDLTWPLTIEAVGKGQMPKTLLSDQQLQEKRTGETLLALSRTADMCHIRPDRFGAGGWFREFDFTNDFVNRATQNMETGGRVTLNVRAYVPEGRKISYWKLNDAKFIFAVPPEEFYVWNLNESMTYQPIFEDVRPTPEPTPAPTPVPEYSVVCRDSCHFSGGGYINAKNGTVPAGTTITVYTEHTDEGWWEGLPFATQGTWLKPAHYDSITFVVNQNLRIDWRYPIN